MVFFNDWGETRDASQTEWEWTKDFFLFVSVRSILWLDFVPNVWLAISNCRCLILIIAPIRKTNGWCLWFFCYRSLLWREGEVWIKQDTLLWNKERFSVSRLSSFIIHRSTRSSLFFLSFLLAKNISSSNNNLRGTIRYEKDDETIGARLSTDNSLPVWNSSRRPRCEPAALPAL